MPAYTPVADVDIASMAAAHLGISILIQSLTPPDNSPQAKAMAFWYPKCRDELLQSAPWNFADTYTNLVQEPVPSSTGPQMGYAAPGWPFSYQYPNDVLQAIAVTNIAGQRFGPQFWVNYWWPYTGMQLTIPKFPFKIMESKSNPGQLCIVLDYQASAQAPLYLFYIQAVTNTALFDPMFVTALSYLLGWRAGTTLRADKDKVQACQANYKQARLDALAQHLNANQQDLERDSPSITARW